ncbi:ARS binding protein 2-domain-containing protein, partial [Apiosordaria backusii]
PTLSPSTARPPLPNRQVNATNIEDAYVDFILHCNPCVPPGTDTSALREAFRALPKSGGKSFSAYLLFDLIKQFDTKQLKTWAELAIKLGVDPPGEGESGQKIQQYAARLKRWMKSMHVDAFFEYLMERESPYWTEIPDENVPIAELEREGVAAEDDMALRALLPHIKPKRGRRRPGEDDLGKSPSQRPSPQVDEGENGGAWTAEPLTGARRESVFVFPPPPDPSRLNPSAATFAHDLVQTPLTATPLTAYPHSAITPSTRASFWADEPRSAITPSRRNAHKRHGAKVVSSAWRRGGVGGTGKIRGRPPNSRPVNMEGPFSAFPATPGGFKSASPNPEETNPPNGNGGMILPRTSIKNWGAPAASPLTTTSPVVATQSPVHPSPVHPSPVESVHSRPAKRSRLSLQVPERVGGEVRLATPPPVVMVNGQATDQPPPIPPPQQHQPQQPGQTASPINYPGGLNNQPLIPPAHSPAMYHDPLDKTNMAEVEGLFVTDLMNAEWFDAQGNKIPACSGDEAWAFTQAVLNRLRSTASSQQDFLINLSALAGGGILMPKKSLKVVKLAELADRTRYKSHWKLRYGSIVGDFSMEEEVMHGAWKKKKDNGMGGGETGVVDWEQKYKELMVAYRKKEEESMGFRKKMIDLAR